MLASTKCRATATAAVLNERPGHNEGRTIFPNPIEVSITHITIAWYADVQVSFVPPEAVVATAPMMTVPMTAPMTTVNNIATAVVPATWDRTVTIPANTEITSIAAHGIISLTAVSQPFTIESRCSIVLEQDTPAWINGMPIKLFSGTVLVI